VRRRQTPSQTVGPFFAFGLTPGQYGYSALSSIADGTMAGPDTPGRRLRLEGRVFDAGGETVPDAMVEIWQADATGRYPDGRSNTGFAGFGRCGTGTDPEHRFVFETIRPGPPGDGQAPHLNVILFMRGMPRHAFTRIYLADEAEANASDPVLSTVPPERRGTLLAAPGSRDGVYLFDIHLRGERETVFFEP